MRHEISQAAGDTAGITQDVGQDPTVGLSRSLSRTSLSDIEPGLCTMCGQEVFCVECGEEPVPGVWLEAPDPDGFEEDAHEVIDEEDEEEEGIEVDKHSSKK
jgi:DNA-directed RNA polymerase II subunit RPB9